MDNYTVYPFKSKLEPLIFWTVDFLIRAKVSTYTRERRSLNKCILITARQ